jgi:hypothetical protein
MGLAWCLGRLLVASEPMSLMASVADQLYRIVNAHIASSGIVRVCWSSGDTRAERATRR